MYKTIIAGIGAGDYYRTHQAIAAYFDGSKHVWRLDGDTATVISEQQPAGELRDGMCVGSFSVTDPGVGESFPVMLRVNPGLHRFTKHYAVALEKVPDWLSTHLPGFEIADARIIPEGCQRAQKAAQELCIFSYNVSATLTVVDAAAAAATLLSGVGRARRFGFGLIMAYR
jgi:hypothetical protein